MTDILQSRRRGWHAIFDDPNLSMESIRQRGINGTVCQSGLRSVCWKIYTGYCPTLELSTWAVSQAGHRQHYSKLKQKFIEEPAEIIKQSNSNQDLTDNNPLALNDNNPWQQYFEDSEIRKTIRQDVDRTFPDVEFFRNPDVQEKMTDILFIYCKLNEDVSYRQGMHELLAPFYWVLTHESWPKDQEPTEPADKMIAQTLDPVFIEHDAYTLFDKIMKYVKPWYEFNERIVTKAQGDLRNNLSKPASTKLNPVVLSCHRIHHKYLRSTDPVLYEHLERFNIEPQLYGMRWLRLLFGREFEFHELLRLWDAIFASDPSLQIAEYVCLTILLRMRDRLLASDYAECLTLLMRAPQVGNPASLVEHAKYLKSDLSEAAGLHVLQQNDLRQGKPPRHSLWEGVQQQQEMHQAMPPNRIAHRRSHGANLDNLASITRGVMKSPQVRDLNRAIAGVMGTVQKNVNMFGDNVRNSLDATPSSRRRLTVSSEFPSDIDRHFTSTNRPTIVPSQPAPPPRLSSARSSQPPQEQYLEQQSSQQQQQQQQQQRQDLINKIVATNRQMAEVLANSIDVLETGLFKQKDQSSTPQSSDGGKLIEKQGPDQALLIGALTGIKHIRDVLSGKQSFDPTALSSVIVTAPAEADATTTTTTTTTIISGNAPPVDEVTTAGSKDDKDWEIVTDDDDKQTTTSSASDHLETKPLPPSQQSNDNTSSVEHHTTTATSSSRSTTTTPSAATTGVTAKQNVVYRIEDLISDPTLQRKESDTSSNKFKWILQDNDENDVPPSNNRRRQQFKPSSSPDTGRMPPLRTNNTSKRTPAGLSPSDITHMTTSPSAIDPLGAKSHE